MFHRLGQHAVTKSVKRAHWQFSFEVEDSILDVLGLSASKCLLIMYLAGAKKIKDPTPVLKDISFLECRSHTESHGLIGTESHAESPGVTELRAVQSYRVTELRAM